MWEKQTFIICVSDEETARKRAMEWYAKKKNLTVDSVEPCQHGGYQVTISYDVTRKKNFLW